MAKQTISLFALVSFFVFSTGCVTWRSADLRTETKPPDSGTAVGSLVRTSGQLVKFGPFPARIRDGCVVGHATNVTPADVSIPLSDVKQIYYRRSNGPMTILLVAGLVGATVLSIVLLKTSLFKGGGSGITER